MKEERIKQILSKIKETVGENNYKLALAITGHRTGKIIDVSMASKEGELLLEYIQRLETNWKEFKKWLEKEKNRLARECSQIYEDSLGKTKLVNEDIFNEINKVLDKIQELESSNNE